MFRRRSKAGHHRILESYALKAEGKWKAIRKAIEDVADQQQPLLLVAHFPETFLQLQDRLHSWELEYEILTAAVTPQAIFEDPRFLGESRFLTLAELLQPRGTPLPPRQRTSGFSVLVAERHPLARHDQNLDRFVSEIDLPTRIGYFLALEDPVPQVAVGDTAVTVMQQLGLNEHELITSQLLTRRIERFTKRLDSTITMEQKAESATEWFLLNYPESAPPEKGPGG